MKADAGPLAIEAPKTKRPISATALIARVRKIKRQVAPPQSMDADWSTRYTSDMLLNVRQREVVRRLWIDGPLSRIELHRRTKMRPNGVGSAIDVLLREGLVRECGPDPTSFGRPPVPIELDPATRLFIGLAISPGQVEVARLGLRGQIVGSPVSKAVSDPEQVVPTACELLKGVMSRQVLAIGVSITGVVDPERQEIQSSSATASLRKVSLAPLYKQAGDVPIMLGNDLHATAARWMLTHRTDENNDVLLVGFDDGSMGSAMLINGKPNHGCVVSCNELGHTRFFVDTERCYCGHMGCLERIASSDFLRRSGAPADATLLRQVSDYRGNDKALEEMVRYLANGLANICNYVRPNRFVLVSRFVRFPEFTDLLIRSMRSLLLEAMADRTQIDLWDQPAVQSAETAGWLALANLYGGWTSAVG